MIGQTISHYRIIEKLGEGGMGVVYKAQDLTLDRFVAIKFLTQHLSDCEESASRFIHEARAASALDHTNIGTIYEVEKTSDGHMFIVMAFYDGETLRDRIDRNSISLDEALDIASQAAAGLARAHEKGIVHRDIKPSNVLVTSRGEVKIVDFGLAKLMGKTRLTRKGGALGTAAYMSPEQARGDEVDERSDIFSLGTLLYELIAGQAPFRGEYEAAILYEIDQKDPEPLSRYKEDIPEELQEIINKALVKAPESRYQNMLDLKQAIDELRGVSEPAIETGRRILTRRQWLTSRSKRLGFAITAVCAVIAVIAIYLLISDRQSDFAVAVLDFRDISDRENLTFSAGVTSLVNVGLVENSPVRVISTSLLDDLRRRLFGKESGPIETGEALEVAKQSGASIVLTGDVTRDGDDLLVMWQLVDTRSGETISAKRERGSDLVACADQVIANVLPWLYGKSGQSEEGAPQSVGELTTSSTRAYEHYIAGVIALKSIEAETAVREFESALEIDSSFALAYFELGKAYFGHFSGEYNWNLARDYIDSAWELRVRLSYRDRLRVEARRHSIYQRIPEAFSIYEEILERWPDDKETLVDYSEELFYWWRFQELASVTALAVESYPDDFGLGSLRCWGLAYSGHAEDALEVARSTASHYPDKQNAWNDLGIVFLMNGLPDSAEAAYRNALEIDPNYLSSQGGLARTEYMRGDVTAALIRYREIFEQPGISPQQRAQMASVSIGWLNRTAILIEAGRLQQALQLIEEAGGLVPDNVQLKANLALGRCEVLLGMGKYEEVVRLAEELNGNPAFEIIRGDSHWFRARALIALGKIEAVREARDKLQEWEENTGVYKFRCYRQGISARLALLESRPGDAIEHLTEMKRYGGSILGLLDIGMRHSFTSAYLAEGRTGEAVKELEKLISVYGGHALAHFELGKIYEQQNQPVKARTAYERFLDMWSEADEGLAQLEDAGTRLAALSGTSP